jgi:hypothetical protein
VIESTFHPEFSPPDLLRLQQRCPFVPLEIRCLAEPSVLVERWKRRSASGERHPGHLEHLIGEEVCSPDKEEQAIPLALNGHVISSIQRRLKRLTTSDFSFKYEIFFHSMLLSLSFDGGNVGIPPCS